MHVLNTFILYNTHKPTSRHRKLFPYQITGFLFDYLTIYLNAENCFDFLYNRENLTETRLKLKLSLNINVRNS